MNTIIGIIIGILATVFHKKIPFLDKLASSNPQIMETVNDIKSAFGSATTEFKAKRESRKDVESDDIVTGSERVHVQAEEKPSVDVATPTKKSGPKAPYIKK